MKITKLAESIKILELVTEIKNKGIADIFFNFRSYSCVNCLDIDIHYPKWKQENHFKISFETDLDKSSNNRKIVEQLKDIADGKIELREDFIKHSSSKKDNIKREIENLKRQLKETA